MFKKISRQKALQLYPKFPQSNYLTEQFFYPNVCSTFTLSLQARSKRGQVKGLSNEVIKLCEVLKVPALLFFGDTRTPWLFQENDYKPAKEAFDFLIKHGLGRRFNGGLVVALENLPTFLYHFIWLTRSNAALPYFYLSDESQRFLIHICQYGNLHVGILDCSIEQAFHTAVSKTDFEYLKEAQCSDRLSSGTEIPGRSIVV